MAKNNILVVNKKTFRFLCKELELAPSRKDEPFGYAPLGFYGMLVLIKPGIKKAYACSCYAFAVARFGEMQTSLDRD